MTLFEKFVTKGNEKEDEQAKDGWRRAGADQGQHCLAKKREEVHEAQQHAASFLYLVEC